MKKEHLNWKQRLYKARKVIGVGLCLFTGLVGFDYYTHLNTTPFTNRTRYLPLKSEVLAQIAELTDEVSASYYFN